MSFDLYHKTFLKSDWIEILIQYRIISLETIGKLLALSNTQIESYVQ
jgi:hypothetical protein